MTSETSAHRRSKLALKGTAVGLALLVGLGSAAHAETIVVQGNRRVDTETIKSYVTGQSAGAGPQGPARDGPFLQR